MNFVKGITKEQMRDVMKGKNQDYDGSVVPCVFTVRINNNHMYEDKNIYHIYVEEVPVEAIIVDYNTGEWHLSPVNSEVYDLPVYLTKAEAIERVKEQSKFWEVEGFDNVSGWSVTEAEMVEARKHVVTQDVLGQLKDGFYRDAFIEALTTFVESVQKFPEPYSSFADKMNKEGASLVIGQLSE